MLRRYMWPVIDGHFMPWVQFAASAVTLLSLRSGQGHLRKFERQLLSQSYLSTLFMTLWAFSAVRKMKISNLSICCHKANLLAYTINHCVQGLNSLTGSHYDLDFMITLHKKDCITFLQRANEIHPHNRSWGLSSEHRNTPLELHNLVHAQEPHYRLWFWAETANLT